MLTPAATAPFPAAAPTAAAEQRASLRTLRTLMWVYLLLWVTEGALRKWVLPHLANPLLIVRDPVLLLIYFMAFSKGVFPKNGFIIWTAVEGILTLLASVATTNIPLSVELYGFRCNFLHLPLIFVIPEVFNRQDLRRVGFWTLVIALPMSVLVLLQFGSRPTSIFNAGAGGAANGMLGSALGHIRPSGTFSFSNGLGGFSVIVAAFFLWQIFEPKLFPRLLWLASGAALVIMVALSGSRSAVGAVGLILASVVLIGFVQPRYWPAAIKMLVLVGLGMLLIGSFSVFKEGLSVFASRFGSASNVQSGFFGRFFDSLYLPFYAVEIAEPLGVGLGMGTNAANGIINDGKRGFLLVEGDIGRVILESGPLLGVTYEMLRIFLTFYLGARAFRSLYQRANTLPLLMFSGIAAVLAEGEFAQPTELGFATIAAGLCLAANTPDAPEDVPSARAADAPILAVPSSTPTARGRSLYAEQMHQPNSESNDG